LRTPATQGGRSAGNSRATHAPDGQWICLFRPGLAADRAPIGKDLIVRTSPTAAGGEWRCGVGLIGRHGCGWPTNRGLSNTRT